MITFIARFLKGLILGWIMSLIMYLVKRALTNAMGGQMPRGQQRQDRQPQQAHRPYAGTSANQNHQDIVETMWVGMSTDQLRRSFGLPLQKETIANGEIWTYANLNGQGTQTNVSIRDSAVTGWQDRSEQPRTAP